MGLPVHDVDVVLQLLVLEAELAEQVVLAGTDERMRQPDFGNLRLAMSVQGFEFVYQVVAHGGIAKSEPGSSCAEGQLVT